MKYKADILDFKKYHYHSLDRLRIGKKQGIKINFGGACKFHDRSVIKLKAGKSHDRLRYIHTLNMWLMHVLKFLCIIYLS